MLKRIIIVAGGNPGLWPSLDLFSKENVWVGVDRGSLFLIEHGIHPQLAIGDFDSLSSEEYQKVVKYSQEIIAAQPEKDHTDTELAVLECLIRYPNIPLTLLGFSGGRLDHFLAKLYLPFLIDQLASAPLLTLIDSQNTLTYYLPGRHSVSKESGKKYLAFICLSSVTDFSISGAKYSLAKTDVAFPKSYASNEFIGSDVSFEFSSGLVAVVQSCDK